MIGALRVKPYVTFTLSGNNDHWTGGNDIGKEGVWKWDSTGEIYEFKDFTGKE